METGRRLQNIGILVTTIAITFVALNGLVSRTSLLGGISLTEFLADEFRIRFLSPLPLDPGDACWQNETLLLSNCDQEFHGLYTWIPGSRIKTNSAGMRDQEYSLQKEVGTYRVFVLGDSVTFGWGVENDEVYTELLEEMLNRELNGHYEVFNLGVPAMATDQEYERLLHYWKYFPDAVVIHLMANDIECGDIRKEILKRLGDPDNNRQEGYRDVIALGYLNTLGSEGSCSCMVGYAILISKMCRDRGIPLIFYGPFNDSLSIQYPLPSNEFDLWGCDFSVINETGVYFVKGGTLKREHLLSRKDPHPDKDGHRRIANDLFPTLKKIINEAQKEVEGSGLW